MENTNLPRITSPTLLESEELLGKRKSESPTTTNPIMTRIIPNHCNNGTLLFKNIIDNIATKTITDPEKKL